MLQLKPGLRLRSQVCATEVIVVRPPTDPVELMCGGRPMVGLGEQAEATAAPAPGLDGGTEMGKRYTTEDESSLEILVTKAGSGTLAVGDVPLVLKDAKPLPSSD